MASEDLVQEIGGYFGFENTWGSHFHSEAIPVNSGRGGLEFLVEARGISKVWLPDYLCDSVPRMLADRGVHVLTYPVGATLRAVAVPEPAADEWLYAVNYFGQLSTAEMDLFRAATDRVIVDNTQAFYTQPLSETDTVYTCRKFFGVPDGGYVSTNAELRRALPSSQSAPFMGHLAGRCEATATEHYGGYRNNEKRLAGVPLASMSPLTDSLMRSLDHDTIQSRRERNFSVLHERLGHLNQLEVTAPPGPFAYPLLIKQGRDIRPQMHAERVYVPTLWPNVLSDCPSDAAAVQLTQDLLPLPVDQRYTETQMHRMADLVEEYSA